MPDHELAMLAYVKLADLSHRKRQLLGRDKFLILAGAAACRAGWPKVSERCRELVICNNPLHLINKSPSFADALRDENFQPFLKQLERFCPYEKAEHLLRELGIDAGVPDSPQPVNSGQLALNLLSGSQWSRARRD